MNEWQRLTPGKEDRNFIPFYRITKEGGHEATLGFQYKGELIKYRISRTVPFSDAELDALAAHSNVVKALVEALNAVGWISRTGSSGHFCPWCGSFYPDHRALCERQAALANIKGTGNV